MSALSRVMILVFCLLIVSSCHSDKPGLMSISHSLHLFSSESFSAGGNGERQDVHISYDRRHENLDTWQLVSFDSLQVTGNLSPDGRFEFDSQKNAPALVIRLPLSLEAENIQTVTIDLVVNSKSTLAAKAAPSKKKGGGFRQQLDHFDFEEMLEMRWRALTKSGRLVTGRQDKRLQFYNTSSHTYRFDLADVPDWTGQLKYIEFAIVPNKPGTYLGAVHRIEMKSLHAQYYDPLIKRLTADDQTKRGYVLESGNPYISDVLPQSCVGLEFSWFIPPTHSNKKNSIQFFLSLSDEQGQDSPLISSDWIGDNSQHWIHEKIDIPPLALKKNQRIKFSMTVKNEDEIPSEQVLWISQPVLNLPKILLGEDNIILIFIDTLSKHHLGCYGYPINTSACIDKLSKKSMLFSDPVSHAPSTTSSHASLLTSVIPLIHGTFNNYQSLKRENPLLSEYLTQRGYCSFAVTGGGAVSSNHNFYRGFHDFIGHDNNISSLWNDFLPRIRQNKDKRFFGFYHTYEVHALYKYRKNITESLFQENSDYAIFTLPLAKQLAALKKKENSAYINAMYDTGIRYTDIQIGKFLHELKKLGLNQDTIVAITSDHGEHLGEYSLFGHSNSLFRELLEVPLLITQPHALKETTGRIAASPVSLIDIGPILLHMADIPIPDWMTGSVTSIVHLNQNSDTSNEVVFSMKKSKKSDSTEYTLTGNEWKLFANPKKTWLVTRSESNELVDTGKREPAAYNQYLKLLNSITSAHSIPESIEDSLSSASQTREELKALGYVE